jgi:hypothetical protein
LFIGQCKSDYFVYFAYLLIGHGHGHGHGHI